MLIFMRTDYKQTKDNIIEKNKKKYIKYYFSEWCFMNLVTIIKLHVFC
jgi:hypothetical protein